MRVAAIELVRDVAVLGNRRILRDVGIQQEQAHAPHIQPPHFDVHRAPRHLHLDANLHSPRVPRRLHRPVVEIVHRVALSLPPVGAQVLLQVARLVQQTDSHQVQPRVAGRFQVIPRQDAQPARIDRERLDQPVLHRKVRHQHRLPAWALGLLRHVFVKRPARLAVHRQVHPVRRRFVQRRLRQPAQHRHRIVAARSPQARVEPAERCANRVIPRPQQVHAQLAQPRERRWECRTNDELPDRMNLKRHLFPYSSPTASAPSNCPPGAGAQSCCYCPILPDRRARRGELNMI